MRTITVLNIFARLSLLAVCFLSASTGLFSQSNHFTVDASAIASENTEFWKAAGSDHLFYHVLRPSRQALLDRMQTTQSNRYFRSHHTTFTQDTKNALSGHHSSDTR